MRQRMLELIVGIFVFLVIIALIFLAFKVSGLTGVSDSNSYEVTANFSTIGSLKVRAPVSIAGVAIGQVEKIKLDPKTFSAVVTMRINDSQKQIPTDSSASIFTEGLLGANYISITPGYEGTYLKNDSKITNTHPALVLENLIGQLLFSVKK